MNLQALAFLAIQAATLAVAQSPTVTLDSATFTGVAAYPVASFLGIPYAQPPVGDLRYRLPQAISSYSGSQSATAFGPSCPQQNIEIPQESGISQDIYNYYYNTVFTLFVPQDEDCLTINVITPLNATPTSSLPVVVWIYGGGFELGSTSAYNGGEIVSRSISLGEPVIYVSMNYRLTGFGFLGGKEVKAAGVGNLGLHDQRLAMQWVQKYISAFGGDPTKVTIWGESAGAISVGLHMVAYNGNNGGLFRAGYMESGSPIPVGPIEDGQVYYDAIVSAVGCSSATDTLACLRTVPYSTLKSAIDSSPSLFSYQSLRAAYAPGVDGVFLTDNPQQLILQGKVANVPFITGDCDDEGTLFSLTTLNVTTDSELETYVKTIMLPGITDAQYNDLATLYPSDVTQGSPFDTGYANALTAEYKRISAINGDLVFHAPRRFFLNNVSGRQNTWSFLSKRYKSTAYLGSYHASDLLNVYFGGELGDYLIYFANNLNPNRAYAYNWPQYTTSSPSLLTLLDGYVPVVIEQDTFRVDGTNLLTSITLTTPF
ncbi:hypothetical protein AX17_005456 [Amanita inopinata Kibby_2008]|nr:hypothetical protein AX17_005456 [Amanita inopinata Kibby_2008]